VKLLKYNDTVDSVVSNPMEEGIVPFNLFSAILNNVNDDMNNVKAIGVKYNCCSFVNNPIEVGIVPVKLFENNAISSIFASSPIEEGIAPNNLFPPRCSNVSNIIFPILLGNVPTQYNYANKHVALYVNL